MRTLSLFVVILSAIACNQPEGEINTDIVHNPETAAGDIDKDMLPVMTFKNELFEFGSITQGEKVKHNFEFENTGASDLIITSAKGSCGCTVPTWPKEPIKPGEKGSIAVVFNSEGKSNKQHKKVTILANTHPSTNVVAISGEVIAPNKN